MEIIFSGVCPYCKNQSDFCTTNAGQVLEAYMMTFFMLSVDPRIWVELATKDGAKWARCSICSKVVLQCPRCGSINRHEYRPAPCLSCGKEYRHP